MSARPQRTLSSESIAEPTASNCGPSSSRTRPRKRPKRTGLSLQLISPGEYPSAFELQEERCSSSAYSALGARPCFVCSSQEGAVDDECRFRNVRGFTYVLAGDVKRCIGTIFLSVAHAAHIGKSAPPFDYPVAWNEPLQPRHINDLKDVSARVLLPLLEKELEALSNQEQGKEMIWRTMEQECRATCDGCMTSIFCGSWMCLLCGREVCEDCYDSLKLAVPGRRPSRKAGSKVVQSSVNILPGALSHAQSCCGNGAHAVGEFRRISRFSVPQLLGTINDMRSRAPPRDQSPAGFALPPHAALEGFPINTPTPLIQSNALSHHTIYVAHDDPSFTLGYFRRRWALGHPLVVTGLLKKFKCQWTPDYFIKAYGTQECKIVECQTGREEERNVEYFFQMLGKTRPPDGSIWKLKDWPPTDDFLTSFPELFEDFQQALPMPSYTRRDGAFNLSSHYPKNAIAPDLGPKMYNAFATSDIAGSKGSTRLHMDAADAINIMLWSKRPPCDDVSSSASTPCAAWDVFRAQDSDQLRELMRQEFEVAPGDDPIHSQLYYLDKGTRDKFAAKGIYSHRIYQRPGEAVFIPAGCAHQVCNLADCIKVAVDFVSPENIRRCVQLTREFRQLNFSERWKEDILQLRTMMWFAWESCSRDLDTFM